MRENILSAIIICLLLFIVALVLLSPGGGQAPSPIPSEQIRTLASALESQGLYAQAVLEYKKYLDTASIPAEQRANILYRIGSLYLDNLLEYENALAAFLEINHLYPQTPIAKEADKRMVRCFEELKRGSDAQRKLKQLTDLETEEEPGSGPVVAQIGDRKITRDQLEQELNQLPESQRQMFNDPEKRRHYLQSKLFEELLYDMALRKEYNKNPDIRKSLRRMEKMLLAQKVLEEEVNQKIQVSEGDIELYFKANPDEFKTPLSLKIAHLQVASEEKAQEAQKAIAGGMAFEEAVRQYSEDERTKNNGGSLGSIYEGSDYITGLGQVPDLVKKILPLDANGISEPLQSPKGYHLFKVLERTPEQVPTLDKVRSQVEARIKQRKATELQDALLKRLLQAEAVKIYDQSLIDSASKEGTKNEATNAK